MSKRFLLIGALVALFPFVFPTNSSAQYRRGPVHRVVVVNSFASPFWYDDPWFYDMQWGGGYGPYGPYGPYHRYVAADSSVKLEVKPKQAEVYVDGYYAGIVDQFDGVFQRLHIESGPHRIEVRAPGYESLVFDVRISPDHTTTYEGEMKKIS